MITRTDTGHRATLPERRRYDGTLDEVLTWARRRTPVTATRFFHESRMRA